MANLKPIQDAVVAMVAEVSRTIGVQNSAKVLIGDITPIVQAAVDAALKADNDVDDAAALVASEAVAAALAELTANTDALAAAVAANPGNPPPPPPPPPLP